MRDRLSFRPVLLRGAWLPVALTLAVACALIGGPATASAGPKPSAGKRCSGLFATTGGYNLHGRAYNLTCPQARSYSRTLPTGWSGSIRNDGSAEHALLYRSRDANLVMRAIQPGGSSADPRILGHRPLVIITLPPAR